MPNPTGYSQHISGYWRKDSDASGPYMYDGTNTPPANAPYPLGSTPVASASGNVANASAVATLAAAAGKTTYICGLIVTSSGATAAAVVNATIAGLVGGTATFPVVAVAGATLANQPLTLTFTPPVPASAVNTAIVSTLPALGAGNTNAGVFAWGYQL